MSLSFKDYVLSGRFNKVANKAVSEAIARARLAGLPMEGSLVASTSDTPSAAVPAMEAASSGQPQDAGAAGIKATLPVSGSS